MRISRISIQNFNGNKLRIPIDEIIYTINGRTLWSKKAYEVREYSNPEAKELYEKAKKTKNIREQIKLYDKMGHFEIKEMTLTEKIKSFFNM